MKLSKKNGILALCLTLVIGAVIWSCSSSSSSTADRPATLTYTGPGSYYSMTMNSDLTFEVSIKDAYTDPTPTMTVSGTYEVLDNGIIEYTVTSSTGTGGPSAGEKAHAIEAVGYGLFLLPLGSSEVIPMMVQGDCPTSNFTANWIMTQNTNNNDSLDINQDFFGTFSYNNTSGEGTVTGKRNLVDFGTTSGGGGTFSTSSCTDGFLQIDNGGGETANMWLTSIGGAMVETATSGNRNSTIFALPKDTNVLADLEGTFRGLFVDNESGVSGGSSSNKNFFVEIEFDAAGNGIGKKVTSINPWVTSTESATLTLVKNNTVGEGWYTGTIDTPDVGTPNVACAFTKDVNDTNKDILMCVAQSPSGIADAGTASTFNLVLVKDSN